VLEGGVAARFFARRGMGDLDLDDLRLRGDALCAMGRGRLRALRARPRSCDRSRVLERRQHRGRAALPARRRTARGRSAAPDAALPPRRALSLAGTDVLIASGDADPYSAPEQIEELAEVLAAGGAEVQVSRQPVGHELTQADLDTLAAWVREHASGA
jgi:phospholipase/carboxylesterase